MPRSPFAICWTCFAAVWLVGCVTQRKHVPLNLPPSARLVEVGGSSAISPRLQTGSIVPVAATEFASRNILVLSGGGANGAYTVGVLNGWSASGARPQFDVVTGISTGALIAPFAFLGSEYDDILRCGYTECQERDVFARRWLPTLLWADSLADSAPLKQKIATQITRSIVAKVAEAHRDGRRLYVGTTDLDTKRLVVWDMGAIAASDDPGKLELFRDVLLASASVPGLLPPVEIDIAVAGKRHTELHVDGGVAASLFLQPAMLGLSLPNESPQVRDNLKVYVIVAGQLRLPRRQVQRRLTHVIEESVGGVLQSQMDGDLLKTYLLSRWAGASFALTAVPRELAEEASPLIFDPRVMRNLYDLGHQHAASGSGWHTVPLSLSPEEQTPPRGSVQFQIEEPRVGRDVSSRAALTNEQATTHSFPARNLWDRVASDLRRSAKR